MSLLDEYVTELLAICQSAGPSELVFERAKKSVDAYEMQNQGNVLFTRGELRKAFGDDAVSHSLAANEIIDWMDENLS